MKRNELHKPKTPQLITIDHRTDKPYTPSCQCCPWRGLPKFTLGEAKAACAAHRKMKPKCKEL